MKPSVLDFLGWRVYFGSPTMELGTAFRIRSALKKAMPRAKIIIHSGPHPSGLVRIVPAAESTASLAARARGIAAATIRRDIEENTAPEVRRR